MLNLAKDLKLLGIQGALLNGEQLVDIRKLAESMEKIVRWFDAERREAYPGLAEVIRDTYYEKKIKDLIDEVHEKLADLEEKGKEIVAQGEALKERVVEEFEDVSKEVTKEASVKIDNTLAHIEELQDRGRATTANLRKKLFKNAPKKR